MSAPAQAELADAGQVLASILKAAVEARCSDVHLRAGKPAFGRVAGRLVQMKGNSITPHQIEGMIQVTTGRGMPGPLSPAFEFSFEQLGVARFRAHAFREGGNWALAMRAIPLSIPDFQALRLPAVIKQLSIREPGLVLITGPTGSGKSTSSAAVLNHIANNDMCHILTLEDPIEYRVTESLSCVTQREIGMDTPSYEKALHAALREDPDVLFVGEIRDQETLEVVMNASETGHTVYSTFHTQTATHTVQRLVGMFPSDEQSAARERLADSLRAVVSQRLLPRIKSRERVLATEVLINNYATKECIRDANKLKQLSQVLERSNDQNMHTFDQSLIQLVQAKLVDPTVAMTHASSPANFKRALALSGFTL